MSDDAYRYAELAEQRNNALLDAIPDGMLRLARDGTCLDIRPDVATAVRLPPEEAIGRSVHDLLPTELATTVLEYIDRTLETRSLQTIEYEIEIDGVARWK